MRGVAISLLMAGACALASACGRADETVPGVAAIAVTIAPTRVEAGGPVLLSYSFTVPPASGRVPADQWVFVRPGTPRRIVGASRISVQFGGFPRVQGWCCAG